MPRTVVLTRDIASRLDNLALLAEETDGCLFYRQLGDYCPIDYLFMMGIGDEGHVRQQSDRVQVANKFFERNNDYKCVMFHTHSTGTISRHGNYFATHFSRQDIDEFKRQLGFDRDYIGMLVTPKTKLLYGIDSPSLAVVESLPGYVLRSRAVDIAINKIARELGCNMKRFQGRVGGI